MAIFKLNQPVETAESFVVVDVNSVNQLPPGTYTFQLVVVDDHNLSSTPAQAKVVVTHPGPVAVLKSDEKVPFGQSFKLLGDSSSDLPPNKITKYVWTLINQ